MIALSAEVRIHLAMGATDLRKGFDGLAALVQQVLHKDPFGGHLFVFRGKRADRVKVLFWDGTGLVLYARSRCLIVSPVSSSGWPNTAAD